MQSIVPVVFAFIFGIASAMIAQKRGRNPIAWFLAGFFFGVFGLLVLLLLPATDQELEEDEEDSSLLPDQPSSSAPPASLEGDSWFYLTPEGEQVGPLPVSDLKQAWEEGTINGDTYVWCEGMEEWDSMKNLKLFS